MTPPPGVPTYKPDWHWADAPWFLATHDEYFTENGYSLALRAGAVAALARLFTPEVCRDIFADPEHRLGAIVILFAQVLPPLQVLHFVELGLDLDAARPWEDTSLLKRLTWNDQFLEAQYELRVWANARRAGFPIERVPEAQAKRPDFEATIAGEAYEVEVKVMNEADIDKVDMEIGEQIRRAVEPIAGLHLSLVGGNNLAERALDRAELSRMSADVQSIAVAFAQARDRIVAAGQSPGRYEAGAFGHIEARGSKGLGEVTALVLLDLSLEWQAMRAARLVRHHVGKFSKGAKGVFVIAEQHLATPLMFGESVQKDAEANPEAFADCRFVVINDRGPATKAGRNQRFAYPVPILGHVLTDPEKEFAVQVGGNRDKRALLAGPAREGQLGYLVDTSRRRTTMRKLASFSPPENVERVTIRFDGSPPEFTLRQPKSDS